MTQSSTRVLFLIRHAEVEGQGRFNGSSDVALTARGHQQAERLAQRAVDWNLERAVGSDLMRVRQTVSPLLEAAPIQFSTDARLRERHFGDWEGLSWDEIQSLYPKDSKRFLKDSSIPAPPRGESLVEVERRAEEAWQEIWESSWSRLALVAHGGINRVLLKRFLGIPRENLFRLAVHYAAVTQVEFWGSTPILTRLNAPPESI